MKNLLADALFHSIWCETAMRKWQVELIASGGDKQVCEKALGHAYDLQKKIKECQNLLADKG